MLDKVCFEDEPFKALIVDADFLVILLPLPLILLRPEMFLLMATIGNGGCKTTWLRHIDLEGEAAHVKPISMFLCFAV